jgi:hypothetical protein
MPKNRTLNTPLGKSSFGIGSGVQIGDGIILTAGHVMYEFNEVDDPSNRSIRTLSGSTIYFDPRNYYSKYESIVMELPNPLPSPPVGASISSAFIEPNLRYDDIVFVTYGGQVDDSDAGLALYLSPSDITTPDGRLCPVRVIDGGVRLPLQVRLSLGTRSHYLIQD